jgi:nucleotide-binding universal stress UspA family protein
VKKVMFFIDTRNPPTQECLSKALLIANAFKLSIDLLIDSRNNHPERWYWPELLSDQDKKVRQDGESDAILTIEKALKETKLKYQKIILTKSSYATQINKLLEPETETLLILEKKLRNKHHPIFQEIQKINAPILLTHDTQWHSPINLAVAIDPLHEDVEESLVNEHLVKLAAGLNKVTISSWPLIHSIYVPPMAIEFKAQIKTIHKETVMDFSSEHNIAKNRVVLISGNPEETIPQWAANNQTDILVIGLLKRSKKPFRWIGSTASALIENTSCDLLLAR